MRKLPPLPKKAQGTPRPMMELVSNKMTIPHRYNSIERVLRDTKREYSQEREQDKVNASASENDRKNVFFRRPVSARQYSNDRGGYSKESIRSRESKGSLDSKEDKGPAEKGKHRQSPHYNRKMRMSMPSISADSWVLYEMKEQKFICGKSNFKRREIASLTKIMNLITTLHVLDHYSLTANKIKINVSKQACTMIGTTAEIKAGIQLTLEDLMYGMMLVSGNDAAHQIAQIIGAILHMFKEGEADKTAVYNCDKLTKLANDENAVGIFIHEMNLMARKIGLTRSAWANPHGLSNVNNMSTAEDVAKLCMFCMKNNQFREIVNSKFYNCQYYFEETNQSGKVQLNKGWLKWENTNKMLWQGWNGVKTGITPNAGPCLAASYPANFRGRSYEFLVILLNSDSMQARWKEVKSLVDWISEDSAYI